MLLERRSNEQGKKALAALVAPFLKDQIPEISELINKMEQEKDKHGLFAIDSVPLEEATIKQYLDEVSGDRNNNQKIVLVGHIHDAYPILKKILLRFQPQHLSWLFETWNPTNLKKHSQSY